MTWEELVEFAKQHISDLYVYDDMLYFYNVDCEIAFLKDGTITADYGGTLAENRTYTQMKSILENLL